MLVLAWDTATPRLELALVEFGPAERRRVLSSFVGDGLASHGQALAPLIQSTLGSLGLAPKDLDLLAVGRGPGSFTGLRVGLALAKGLAFAANLPLLGLSSLAVLAAGAGPGLVAPLIDAKRREIFTTIYRVGPGQVEPLTDILALGPDRLWPALLERKPAGEPLVATGPGLGLVADRPDWAVPGGEAGPSAERLAALALEAYRRGESALYPVVPLYGRSPEIFKAWRPPCRLGLASD
jgi:tRNA threonylcarbamoyladenosine biosynthesis protein TsaB